MAAAASSVPANLFLGFRRLRSRKEVPAISPPQTLVKFRDSYRLGNAVGRLQLKRQLPKVFASSGSPPPNSNADKGKADSISDGPPLATILAGIIVFLIFCWIIGSIIMWIIGLIVNVPLS